MFCLLDGMLVRAFGGPADPHVSAGSLKNHFDGVVNPSSPLENTGIHEKTGPRAGFALDSPVNVLRSYSSQATMLAVTGSMPPDSIR